MRLEETVQMQLPRYEPAETYDWNYTHAPDPVALAVPSVPGDYSCCGQPVGSPLAIAAGPLLCGRWILYYASLGFDVLTYKTVRSGRRESYDLPNLVPVPDEPYWGREAEVRAAPTLDGSWAVSFGMPSQPPDVWRRDVEWTRRRLSPDQRLSVSVVGTMQPGWTTEDLAADYAQCAAWAVEAGADMIEANFSCPNVTSCDGDLYQRPGDASVVATALRNAIGSLPLILKIGHMPEASPAADLLAAVADSATALAMTNTVPAFVRDAAGRRMFDGQRRGICGAAVLEASLAQVAMFSRLIAKQGLDLRLIGVGGVASWDHVRRYRDAGAECVQIATAAMRDPSVGIRIRRQMAEQTDGAKAST